MNSSPILRLPQKYKHARHAVSIDGPTKKKRRRCSKSVKFSHLDTVHTIPPCRNIDQTEKESRWYTHAELTYSKNAARFISRVWKCWLKNSSDERDSCKINNLQHCSESRMKMQNAFLSHYPMNEVSGYSGRSSISNHFYDVSELDYSPHGLEYQIHDTRFQIRQLVVQLTLLLNQNNESSINIQDNYRDLAQSVVHQCNEWTTCLARLGGSNDEIRASRVLSYESCSLMQLDFDLIKYPLPSNIARLIDNNKRQQIELSRNAISEKSSSLSDRTCTQVKRMADAQRILSLEHCLASTCSKA